VSYVNACAGEDQRSTLMHSACALARGSIDIIVLLNQPSCRPVTIIVTPSSLSATGTYVKDYAIFSQLSFTKYFI